MGESADGAVPVRRRAASTPEGAERAYRITWTVTTLMVAAPAAVVGLLAIRFLETVGVAAAVGALVSLGQQLVTPPRTRSAHVQAVLRASLIGTGSCVSVVGMVRFLGPVGVMLLALLAVCSPPVLGCCRGGLRALRGRLPSARVGLSVGDSGRASAVRDVSAPPDGPLGPLTDSQLCLAWRISFLALLRSPDLDRTAHLVRRRQEYLDELERRNPAGFARWLYAGARPASDPSRYLLGPQPGRDAVL